MRYIFSIIGAVIITVSLVAIGFTIKQVNQEKITLTTNLEQRASLLADSLKESVEPYYENNAQPSFQSSLQKIVDKFANRERLAGIALYDNKGILLATSSGLPKAIIENKEIVSDAMDSNTLNGNFFDADGENRYVHVDPLHNDESIVGALMIVQNAGYINTSIREIWKGNLLRLLIQIIIFSITIFIVLRFFVFRQVVRLVESVKKIRLGENKEELKEEGKYSFFAPLAKEIAHISRSLLQARSSASEEARMRLEKLDTPWTAERLKEFIKAYLKDQKIFLVFTQEPYEYSNTKGVINYKLLANGVATAFEPLMEACDGMWIAQSSNAKDKDPNEDENIVIKVPPDNPKYTLKRVWLTANEENGYNKGYSIEGLYPLCLNTHTRPMFREQDWIEYKKVNEKFAKALLAEIKNVPRPIIIINEYYFTLLPKLIKRIRPDARIGIFWHTPWPSAEAFSICPQRKEILTGMLSADIIGFNTPQFCNNFIDTIGKNIEALIDFDKSSITHNEHTAFVKTFPISIAFTNEKDTKDTTLAGKKILEQLKIKTKYLGLGVDRMDYAKGIPERFKGIEHFLDTHPEYREQFTFLQIAPLDRSEIKKYIEYKELVLGETERINKKFGTKDWQPIVLEMIPYSHADLNSLYKLANVCVITSLHDSMNLVCKEYVAERNDELGVLILSQFAGAAHDMKGAIIINPYSTKEIADAIHKGLTMSPLEQTKRMKTMRSSVKNYNIYRWAAELLKAIAEL
ncbi:MAG: trehalose-6-phosphate synthase [Candidatus Parcubacteria bacterium]|nr:trehalose-6-phosphate synthase [Candidatus Parcubacteria bacterium]